MRDEYLIRNTHRTFRAWLLLLALSEDNLNAISCIQGESKKTDTFDIQMNNKGVSFFLLTLYSAIKQHRIASLYQMKFTLNSLST